MLGGSEELKQKYLTPARGAATAMFSYCLSEPEAGSDAAAMKTRAVRDGDSWVLERGEALDHQRRRRRVLHGHGGDRPRKRSRGISAFVVEKDDEGFTLRGQGEEARHQGLARPVRSTSTTSGSLPTG